MTLSRLRGQGPGASAPQRRYADWSPLVFWATRPDLDPLRKRLWELHGRLNELSGGLIAHRGISTFTLRELRRLTKQVDSPDFMEVLRLTAREELKFYVRLRRGLDRLLEDRSLRPFLRICRWLGIDLEETAREALREDDEHLRRIGWWPPPDVRSPGLGGHEDGAASSATVPPKTEPPVQDPVLGGSGFWVEAKYVPCYQPRCRKCPHGPYLYLRWRDSLGRKRSKYLGRGEICLRRLHDLAEKLGIPADAVRGLEQQIRDLERRLRQLPPKTDVRLRGHETERRRSGREAL